jgi:hypothetical protein
MTLNHTHFGFFTLAVLLACIAAYFVYSRRAVDVRPDLFRQPILAPAAPAGGSQQVLLGLAAAILFSPVLVLMVPLSIPFAAIARYKQDRQERRFKERMVTAGRTLSRDSAQGRAAQGILILEQRPLRGRTGFCGAPDGLAEVGPFRYALSSERSLTGLKPEFARFRAWRYENYLNAVSGKASLVEQSGSGCRVTGRSRGLA